MCREKRKMVEGISVFFLNIETEVFCPLPTRIRTQGTRAAQSEWEVYDSISQHKSPSKTSKCYFAVKTSPRLPSSSPSPWSPVNQRDPMWEEKQKAIEKRRSRVEQKKTREVNMLWWYSETFVNVLSHKIHVWFARDQCVVVWWITF